MPGPTDPRPAVDQSDSAEHLALLREQNALLRRQIRDNSHLGIVLVRGMIIGLGTAIGATVILSLAVYIL
ncbi:MAG: hypothetical protein MH204_10975, partial [Fimbriimonadaceae bacterium]|nr:hypothetical protein [Fimbriimonadaceae bacterium]